MSGCEALVSQVSCQACMLHVGSPLVVHGHPVNWCAACTSKIGYQCIVLMAGYGSTGEPGQLSGLKAACM